jgi:hypothetical protein
LTFLNPLYFERNGWLFIEDELIRNCAHQVLRIHPLHCICGWVIAWISFVSKSQECWISPIVLNEGEHSGFRIWDIKFTLACVNSVVLSVVLALLFSKSEET